MKANIGDPAPALIVSEWIQGPAVNLDNLHGQVVLVEVFQVNCPGCFLYALPEAIELHQKYHDRGLTILGIATAFEDFSKNTVDNLRLLLDTGLVIGETFNSLSTQGLLRDGKYYPLKLPFPVAMDSLIKNEAEVTEAAIMTFIQDTIPGFDAYADNQKKFVIQQVWEFLRNKEYIAETFETYRLQGTPSSILIDRDGILRDVSFGQNTELEDKVLGLLDGRPAYSSA
jgi:peroxiredoxin